MAIVRPIAAPRSLFASAGDEPRRRRVDDAVALGAGVLGGLAASLVANGSTARAEETIEAIDSLLGWLDPLWQLAYGAASVLVVVLLVAAAASRRAALVRDIVVAGVIVYVVSALLSEAVSGRWPSLGDALWRVGDPEYPSLRVALVSAVVMVAVPDLTRPMRVLSTVVVALCLVAAMVLGSALPAHALGGLAVGIVAGAAVRLWFGSSAGFPHERRVRAGLTELGIESHDLARSARQLDGVARYRALTRGGPSAIAVYGRDARDAQLLARAWRRLWYRDAGPAALFTRREQVEHEGLMLYIADRAGVRVPEVVTAGLASTGDALLVTLEPDAPTLAEVDPQAVTDAVLADVWSAAAALREARIGHGRLDAWSLLLQTGTASDGAGRSPVIVTGLAGGRLNADDSVLDTDTAGLLVSCALLVGEERAMRAARAGVGDAVVEAALPFVQRAALTPRLRDEVKRADFDLDHLREQVVGLTGGELPKFAELRRVSLRGVVLLGLTAIAVYTLLSQLADVGWSTLADEFASAQWSWVLLGFVLAQGPIVCDAHAVTAAVGMPLPFGPTVLLESAVRFISLTVPSAAGKIALTTRYLERQGVALAVALTQGSIDGLAGFVVQALVLVITIPMVNLDIDLGDADISGLIWAGVAVLVIGFVAGIVALVAPSLRRRVWPVVQAALSNVGSLVRSPARLAKLVGANAASQLFFALVLGCSVRAFGGEATLPELLLINTGVSLLGGLVPIPGGIGVMEAGLTAGLVAVGNDQSTALAATLTHRMLTYYLPPVWGWFSLRWLSRRGFV
jgi:uncharacterized membrane protein YbhN (UPF0104 family)